MDAIIPRGFLAWIPFLYTRVLFPGASNADSATRGHWLSVLLLPAVLLYPFLSFHLFEPDEGRYAQIPREMFETGEWIVPTLQGEPYLDKPPFFYWLVMLSYSIFGCHDWAARLVPALATHATIVVAFLLGQRLLGARSAWWGAMALLLAPGFLGVSRLLLLDGLFAFFVIAALAAGYRAVAESSFDKRWWWLCAVLAGLGILTKGPVLLVLIAAPLCLHRRLTTSQVRIGWRDWFAFIAIVLAVTLPWHLAMCWKLPGFARYFFWEHHVLRFMQPFDHERPVWFYAPILLGGLLPATLLLWPLTKYLVGAEGEATRPVGLGFSLMAGLWCVAFFSMSGCKLPTYILPAFPMLALVCGHYIAVSGWATSPIFRVTQASWLVLIFVAHAAVVPYVAQIRSPMNREERIRELCQPADTKLFCFPRNVDSLAFYLGRSDLTTYRSKDIAELFSEMEKQPRSVVLTGHRNSLGALQHHMPPTLRIVETTKLGLCDLAVVERN